MSVRSLCFFRCSSRMSTSSATQSFRPREDALQFAHSLALFSGSVEGFGLAAFALRGFKLFSK
jgi:hypothetical protein